VLVDCRTNSVFIRESGRSNAPVRKIAPATAPIRAVSWASAAALAVLGLVAYRNSFGVPFLFDDFPAIVENPGLRPPYAVGSLLRPEVAGGATVAGRPLLNLSFAFNFATGGLRVGGYHAVNLAIHVAAAWLLFGIVRRLSRPAEGAVAVGLGVAALWLTHPLQTESVTYIVQRAEALAGFWILLALYGFVRASAAGAGRAWLGVSVAASALGMATKETVAVAPVLVLLVDRTWVAGSFAEAWRRRRTYYLALAATGAVLGALLLAGDGRGGTAGFATGIPIWNYALTQCQGIVLYLTRTLWPVGLVFDYGPGVVAGVRQVGVQAVVVAVLLVGTVWALVRRPTWGFFGAVFFLLLAPSSSVVPVAAQTLAEHRMYLAVGIPILLVVLGLRHLAGRHSAWILAGLVVATTVLTDRRNADYRDDLTIWEDTAAKWPINARAWHNAGMAYLARGQLDEAARCIGDATALVPEEAEYRYSLGLVLARQGRPADAAASYEEVLRRDPRHAGARNNLANLLTEAGRVDEAAGHYEEALRLQPQSASARIGYANLLIRSGRPADALVQCEEAIRLQPDLAAAYLNAGNACIALGRRTEAARYYEEALRRAPDYAEAYHNLGNLRLEAGDLVGAVGYFEQTVRLSPGNFAARSTLAVVLLNLGRAGAAIPHLEQLAREAPGDRDIAAALAEARAMAR
jgi:tetratricopeptide (TPR) repeat protein